MNEQTREELIAEIGRLKKRIEVLEEENRQLISGKYWEPSKNERNAGRKPKLNDEIKDRVNQYKAQGMSFREIAEKMGLSVGFVHKTYHS